MEPRKVFNGLRMLKSLMGVEAIAKEQVDRKHFDALQKCALLAHFTTNDARMQVRLLIFFALSAFRIEYC